MTEQTFAYWLNHGITDSWHNKINAAILRDRKVREYHRQYLELKRANSGRSK